MTTKTSTGGPDWTAVGLAYADSTQTVASICHRFAISATQLRRERLARGWTARPSAVPARSAAPSRGKGTTRPTPAALIETLSELTAQPIPFAADRPDGASPRAIPPEAKAAQSGSATSTRKATIAKFYDAIHRDIGRIDKLMDAANLKAGDLERLVRSLASIIHSYERVLELDPATRSTRGRADPKSHRPGHASTNASAGFDAAGAADAERLRRQIAERLERLMENGLASRTPVEPAP
ncbi:MAG: hypothetical protein K2Y05_10310 [Hyphomicrobiaceae bacterium]|nr:hypothetical protein [Hyphomicrobiaceae bacterium]